MSDATRTQLVAEGLRALAMGREATGVVRDVQQPVYGALDRAREERDAYRAALVELVTATGRLDAGDGGSDALFGVLDMRTRACAVLDIDPAMTTPHDESSAACR